MKIRQKEGIDIICSIKKWICWVLLGACILEMIFFFSFENLYGCLALIYGWLLVSTLVFNRNNIPKYPLPTLAIFTLGFCYYFLPLVITFLENKPLTFNFQVPYLTFTNQIISITVICLAYKTATQLYKPTCLLNKIWNKIGYMTVLSERQVWIVGTIGFLALIIQVLNQGQEREYQSTGNWLSIIITSLSYFSIAPVCLLFNELYGDRTKIYSKKIVLLYIMLLIIIGVATTRRALIFNAAFNIILIYLFIIIYNNRAFFNKKNVVIVTVLVYLFTGPIADLAASMIINRELVHSMSAGKTFNEVWKLYNDKERLQTYYKLYMMTMNNDGNNEEGWSEYYVDNIFLDRFCNIRTIDGTLYNAQKMGFGCTEGIKYYENFWINELPSPIANALGLKKDFLGTATDHMVVNNFSGDRYSLFGNKVGGETGIGLWMFGYSYYIIAFLTYIVIFYILCSFVNINTRYLIIPIPILVSFRTFCMFFLNANGIFSSMNYTFARSSLNTILIYCVLIYIIRIFVGGNYKNRIQRC